MYDCSFINSFAFISKDISEKSLVVKNSELPHLLSIITEKNVCY